ncbi:hypothetical protein LT330_002264 [Penicillium expansum]|uniref:Uncharacterized protein n=1 Tax=Penicillium expansum TaxID=27334 RepID=A0A0A2J795_PENEN|nr:hypothetical protein PEX2_036530 [Penicillium expansum]KAJ5500259.1 hypothetical protein N7453_009310 [Penicillium expansum]KAK4863486.1 hypothetical protein LT330_002264 [Penicillium expansum]KGO41292.1 hypothetical protein PEXP_106720 [Penicillium expansum]KGO50482.1 hypothetical protein PEX2_036530 [Penicillium expansum]KGO50573.1 hypothetical protein PEX1_040600 [Penicillium expansum]
MASTDIPQPIQSPSTSNNPFFTDSNKMASSDTPQYTQTLSQSSAFKVDFTWKKWKGIVSDVNNPSDPLYTIHYSPFSLAANMVFKKAPEEEVIGIGKLNAVSINADYELRGQKAHLLAQKRWRTVYTHRSLNFSDTESPVTMTWTSDCGFKTWDFVCVDEEQMPVAKFSANAWGVTKIGKIEFMGPKADDRAAQEEIMVTGITLFYCMMLRCNNIFNLFGAIFARPGHKQHIEPQHKAIISE